MVCASNLEFCCCCTFKNTMCIMSNQYFLLRGPHCLQSPLGVNVLVLHLVDEVVPLRCCRACPGRVAASFCHFRQAWCCRTREANVGVGRIKLAVVAGGGFDLLLVKRYNLAIVRETTGEPLL